MSNDVTALILLRNGSQEPQLAVLTTTLALNRLMETNPLALYDLVQLARVGAEPFGDNMARLRDLSLVRQDGTLHDSVRNIVLSSFEGDDLDMQRVDPIRT